MDIRIFSRRGIFQLDLEEYLRGVLPSEIYASWPDEALAAFAVIARTYAFYAIKHPRHEYEGCHVCDTTHCQMWAPDKTHARTDEAIERTRGLYLYHYPSGLAPIEALYFSHCDGMTLNSEEVFGEERPYLRARLCFCGFEEIFGHGVGACQWELKTYAGWGWPWRTMPHITIRRRI